MIAEDYVSFEVAKLLKEKGFDLPCHATYDTAVTGGKPKFSEYEVLNYFPYGIKNSDDIGWYFEVFDLTQRDVTGCALLYQVGIPSKEKTFETCEEACEAGIRYCLENLI